MIALLTHQVTFDQVGVIVSSLSVAFWLLVAALNWDATE